jgi:hypothetical protein
MHHCEKCVGRTIFRRLRPLLQIELVGSGEEGSMENFFLQVGNTWSRDLCPKHYRDMWASPNEDPLE